MLVFIKVLLLYRSTTILIHQKSFQLIYFKNVQLAMTFDVSVDQVPCAVYQQCSFITYPVNHFILFSIPFNGIDQSIFKYPCLLTLVLIKCLLLHISTATGRFKNLQDKEMEKVGHNHSYYNKKTEVSPVVLYILLSTAIIKHVF